MQDITDCLSLEAQNVAETRLAAKRAARAEAREIRMKELERQQKEVEERSDKDFGEKDSLAEVEEKYKRSMVTNAQLDNEKTSLQYQVDTLREVLLELEEELAESRRQYDEKHKESERQKHDQNVLRFQLAEMKEALEQRESLLTKHGIPLDSIGTPNGDASLEPHVNTDGRPDPPIRTTSMGPSEEAVEKKETMPVVGEIPPSKAEQANQEILLTAPSETQHNAEIGDKEQKIQEIASSSNDVVDACQTNLEPQEAGLQLDLELSRNEYAPENLNKKVLAQNFSEPQREETMEQRNTSPEESEVFQDALDNVVQSPCVVSEEQSISAGAFGSKDHNIGQQDFSKQEDRCKVQSTSIQSASENNEASDISGYRDNATVNTDNKIDHHIEEHETSSPDDSSQDEHETSSSDVSSQDDSEESIAEAMTTPAVEDQKVHEAKVKPDEQSVHVELGLQCKEDDSEKADSNATLAPSDKELVSVEATIHADIHNVVARKKNDISPEQSVQDVQFRKEEKPLVDHENNNFGEVAGPCILSNRQNTFENEALEDDEALMDGVSHVDQHEDTTEAGSLNLETPENEKISTAFLDAKETELLNKEQDIFSENSVCGNSENMNDKPVPFVPVAPATELSGEGKPSDHSNKIENPNDNVSVVAETQKEAVISEPLSSEGESTPEREESDENNDDEDMALRSEKYTGESLPVGSSVDQISSDDIRMEDSSDKASRRGKGKNKEDCVIS